jgi:hypothetical protein
MSAIPANGITGIEGVDAVAIRLLLENMRDRLEILNNDVMDLYQAMGGPPGSIRALAAQLLDPYVDPPHGSREGHLRPLTAAECELLGLPIPAPDAPWPPNFSTRT